MLLFNDQALNQLKTVNSLVETNKKKSEDHGLLPQWFFILLLLHDWLPLHHAHCLFADTLNISFKCSHRDVSSRDLPVISWSILPACCHHFLQPSHGTAGNREEVEEQEQEEDFNVKPVATRWSLIPPHLLLLFLLNIHHDILFMSPVTFPTLGFNPSATVSPAEACSGQVSNGYGPLKMHGGAIQSLTTEGNVKPLHCPPLTGVV